MAYAFLNLVLMCLSDCFLFIKFLLLHFLEGFKLNNGENEEFV